jgi:sugar O-acyltransferase (sialic acid O-acetyltransferase NeuD family)
MNRTQVNERCIVFGAGQHAKVIVDTMIVAGLGRPRCILDPDSRLWRSELLSVPVIGGDEQLPALIECGVTHFVVGVGSTGDASVRTRVFKFGVTAKLQPLTIIHPSATCSPTATIGAGSQVLAGAIVNTSADLGENVLVNTGAIIEHDCVIAAHSHISTGARLAGGVCVGAGAHVGVGAAIRQGVTIGARAIVGAGAAVVRDVPPDMVVVGVPARKFRELVA